MKLKDLCKKHPSEVIYFAIPDQKLVCSYFYTPKTIPYSKYDCSVVITKRHIASVSGGYIDIDEDTEVVPVRFAYDWRGRDITTVYNKNGKILWCEGKWIT